MESIGLNRLEAHICGLLIVNLVVECEGIGWGGNRLVEIRATVASVGQRADLLSATFSNSFHFFHSRLDGILLRVPGDAVDDLALAGDQHLF